MRQRHPPARPKRRRAVQTLPTSIRLTDEPALAMRDEVERTQRPIAWIVRRAQVAGTGLDVWRIVELLKQYGSIRAVRERIPLLTEDQIDLAPAYARSFPGEIRFFREVEKR